MKLDSLELTGFRNYTHRVFTFDKGTTVLVGPNTVGKTNVLEAINLLAMGESFREGKIEEMVKWESEVGHVLGIAQEYPTSNIQHSSNIQSSIAKNQTEEIELQVTLTRGVVQGKRVSKRRYLVNGVGRQKQKLVGNLIVVVFRPEDLRIIEGSPGRRRKFLDSVLVQVDREYARSLTAYGKGLRRRNKVLEMIREGKTNRTALAFWDQLVIKNGEYIQLKRRELEEFFNSGFKIYDSRFKNKKNSFLEDLRIVYAPSVMSEARLAKYEMQEVAAGYTLVGPHRDDFVVISNSQFSIPNQTSSSKLQVPNGRNLAIYGSRGEQRLGVLWLKVRTLEFAESKIGQRPVLLLDDIFSELDKQNREMVKELCGRQQTIVTTAEETFVSSFGKKVKFIKLTN